MLYLFVKFEGWFVLWFLMFEIVVIYKWNYISDKVCFIFIVIYYIDSIDWYKILVLFI